MNGMNPSWTRQNSGGNSSFGGGQGAPSGDSGGTED
jgi:hypothetical protein